MSCKRNMVIYILDTVVFLGSVQILRSNITCAKSFIKEATREKVQYLSPFFPFWEDVLIGRPRQKRQSRFKRSCLQRTSRKHLSPNLIMLHWYNCIYLFHVDSRSFPLADCQVAWYVCGIFECVVNKQCLP